MKSLFYALAVVSIIAAGFFSWQVKDKYAKKQIERDDLKQENKILGQNIVTKQDEKKVATTEKQAAVDARAEVFAQFDSSTAQGKQLARDLEEVEDRFDQAKAKQAEVNKIIKEIEEMFPGTDLDGVPAVYEGLVTKQRTLEKELEEQELAKEGLVKEVTKNNTEIKRVETNIAESKARIRGNDFQATVTSVNNEWDFLVIAAGESSGLAGDSRLLVQRGGRLIGKVAISSLEANQAVAEVVPGSLAPGTIIRPGDQVILEKVHSN